MTSEQKLLNLISSQIKGSEFENSVFLAGGAVRDEIMGIPPKDIDLLVSRDNGGIEFAIWLTKKNNCFVESSNPVVFKKFGTAKFNLRGTKFEDITIECVMTRTEKYKPDSRKPEVKFAGIKDDVFRRDLTINSLLKNISSGEILDLTGRGISDIKNKIIRTPLNPNITFVDDPLRMLRVIRFAAKFDFEIDSKVYISISNNTKSIKLISFERIQEELNKILLTDKTTLAFNLLCNSGLLSYIIPELPKLRGLIQNKYHAFDAWYHTMRVIENSSAKLPNRWAALLHDIGKPKVITTDETGIHFYEHHVVGAGIAENILKRLKFSNDFTDTVVFCVKNHMRLMDVHSNGTGISDKGIRKLIFDSGDNFEILMDIINADSLSHHPDFVKSDKIESIRKRIDNFPEPKQKVKLPLNGFDIMEEFDLKPGVEVGVMLNDVLEMYLENPMITRDEALQRLNKFANRI